MQVQSLYLLLALPLRLSVTMMGQELVHGTIVLRYHTGKGIPNNEKISYNIIEPVT